jgi:hypothetical protein
MLGVPRRYCFSEFVIPVEKENRAGRKARHHRAQIRGLGPYNYEAQSVITIADGIGFQSVREALAELQQGCHRSSLCRQQQ